MFTTLPVHTVPRRDPRVEVIADFGHTAAWLVSDRGTGRCLGSVTRHGRDGDAEYSVRRSACPEGPFQSRSDAVTFLAITDISWPVDVPTLGQGEDTP